MDDVFVGRDGTIWLSTTYSREDNDANPGVGALTWALGQPDTFQYSGDSPSCGTEGLGVSCWDPVAVREVTYPRGYPHQRGRGRARRHHLGRGRLRR